LKVAATAGLTVAEVIRSNVVLVVEDELMRILTLVRNSYLDIIKLSMRSGMW
jgi:hypothetical protein